MSTRILAGVVCLFALLCSCLPLPSGETEAINNRPQSWKRFVALLRLESKPLLMTTSIDDEGLRQINGRHKQALLAEQERVIAELQQLSDEIDILFRYRLVLNGLAVVAPEELRSKIGEIAGISQIESQGMFRAPRLMDEDSAEPVADDKFARNSVKFIGSERVHETLTVKSVDGTEVAVRGNGVRVAIIDTGIDYLHKMFGGAGNVEEYKANDPTVIEEDSFPTRKVIAGIDLVGNGYDASSTVFDKQIPRGDPDPLDESGHGTHVAGSVAGHGDGVNTYDGVAPEASLLAIKVFGGGSTGEAVILRGIEFAIDPNGDFELDDQTHVINMSLGSSFGGPYSLYQEAIGTAVQGGTVVVVSAGNSGFIDYVVGDPSTADEAISVGASIDNADHNWKRPAIKLTAIGKQESMIEAVESPMSKPIAEIDTLTAPLYYIGLADKDLSEEQQDNLAGKIALIDRGLVTFVEKIDRAVEAGAIGVIVANNVASPPLGMGGSKKYEIPAVMISLKAGDEIKIALENGDVTATFEPNLILERRELIDTLASFSSQGPRSFDSFIKPEIVAPGVNIVSAAAGSGDEGRGANGTSMSAPHVSGVVALMRQYRPQIEASMIKSLLLANTEVLSTPAGDRYPIAQQGGGRVDAYQATTAEVVFQPATLSLGRTIVAHRKRITAQVSVHNTTDRDLNLTMQPNVVPGFTLNMPNELTVTAGQSREIDLTIDIDGRSLTEFYTNLDGFIELLNDGKVVARLPLLLGVKKLARVDAVSASIHASSAEDSYRALIDVELQNSGPSDGKALLFELIDNDERKVAHRDPSRSDGVCDLQSVGYRIRELAINDQKVRAIQFAVKLYYPLTSWDTCEVSVQFDGNGDGIADQELIGGGIAPFTNSCRSPRAFGSILADAARLRNMRRDYESQPPMLGCLRYPQAVLSFLPLDIYDHSTLMVVSAPLDALVKDRYGDLQIKLAVTSKDGVPPHRDDYLGDGNSWRTVYPNMDGAGFWNIPDHVIVPQGGKVKTRLIRGGNPLAQLIAYFPYNASTFSHIRNDHQSRIIGIDYLPTMIARRVNP